MTLRNYATKYGFWDDGKEFHGELVRGVHVAVLNLYESLGFRFNEPQDE
jgi:hypothetical protein